MDYEKRFSEIKNFLLKHQYLHELELLERFPQDFIGPYHAWNLELQQLNFSDLLDIEKNFSTHKIKNPEFITFIETCKNLSEIPFLKLEEFSLPQNYKRKLTPKKIHEVQLIKSYVDQLEPKNIIDIGGGVGHLSSALLLNNNKESFCIDTNLKFHELGRKRLKQWLPEIKDKLHFVHHECRKDVLFPKDLNTKEALIVGLHACGPLSTYIVQSIPRYLINFACCYHKLNDEYNISQIAQMSPLSFTNHALTLAAKCLGTQSIIDLEDKFQVKRYRYTLHFYLQEQLQQSFITLGNAKAEDYQRDFAHYAKKYCPELNEKNDKELISYFLSPLNQKRLQYYFRAGVIRALLGRLIEIYLLLDRVLYLNEKGRQAKIYQFFKSEISPRNLGIIV